MTVDIWPKPSPESTYRLKGRRRAKAHADFCGYFWAPCPACGQMFGGHEASRLTVDVEMDGRIAHMMVCPAHDPVYPDGFNVPEPR